MFSRQFTRRTLLAASTAALLHGAKLKNVGGQLYTLRNVLGENPLAKLKQLEALGYTEVEAIFASLPTVWPALRQTSLKPVSLHLDTAMFASDEATLAPALDDAKAKGFRFVVCPYIAPANRGGAEVMHKLAGRLNRAGEQCHARGLRLCYHNHAFEFEPSGNGTLLDVLLENTDRTLVGLEMDIMWVKVGGGDPAALLKKYKGRVPLLHLKDLAPGVEQRFNEKIPKEGFKEVGFGTIDVPAVLRAARASGVEHYFVEQDQTPGDPLASLMRSIEYLKKLDF